MQGKILLVDDSKTMRSQTSKLLEDCGYKVVTAWDGKDALRKTGGVELIITDLHMPRMDGVRMLELLRAEEATKELPVLVVTSAWTPAYRGRLEGLGVSGVLLKPFKPESLLEAMSKIFSRSIGDEAA